MKSILKVEHIKKSHGNKVVLDDISFKVNAGDIMAFIGPNGSGKTTTIKLILGLQKLSEGKITINGYDNQKEFTKAIEKVGAIVENPDSYMYLSGYDNLKLIANSYKGITTKEIYRIIKLVKLERSIHEKVSKYSLGMRQRLGIAKALIINPNLLVFDEPTNGLDPEGIKDLKEILLDLSDDGIAILISSHNLSELESFCNKVCVIDDGKVVESGSIEKITEDQNVYVFDVDNVKKVSDKNISVLNKKTFEKNVKKKDLQKYIKSLLKDKVEIYGISVKEITLEDAFLEITGGGEDD